MIVGAIVGPVSLGYFLLAFNVASWAQSIVGTAVRYVSIAGFSRLSEGDDRALADGVQRSMSALVTVVAPITALTSGLAGPLIAFLYGGQWSPAVPALRVLAVFTLVSVVTGLAMDSLMGAGATRATMWVQIGWAAALIPVLWAATSFDGIRGAALAHAGVGLLVAVPLAALAVKGIGVDVARMGPGLVRPLAAGALACAIATVTARLVGPSPVLQLLVAGGIGMLAYLTAAVPRAQLHRWLGMRRGRKPANVLSDLNSAG
jgi:PST family polysaccharide transporter